MVCVFPPSILDRPDPSAVIALPDDFGTRFCLFVDTEEEFDWNAPFSRTAHSVSTQQGVAAFQSFAQSAGLAPVYVTDYPVLDNPAMAGMLAQWVADGQAAVGAHLHPWVNPPHAEPLSRTNSFAGNLPEPLERAKLFALRDKITAVIGVAPTAFRAGRYGAGPATARLLIEAGFSIDSSVRSRFDYRRENGPCYIDHPLVPYLLGEGGALVELPLSTGYVGTLREFGTRCAQDINNGSRAAGLLARLGLLQRVPLTPEGIPVHLAIAAIDSLLEERVPLLSLSFHSPTTEAGNTVYVKDASDLAAFYRWWDVVLNHLAKRGVAAISLSEIESACQAGKASGNADAAMGACSSMVRAGRS